jgi:hypothetical protein
MKKRFLIAITIIFASFFIPASIFVPMNLIDTYIHGAWTNTLEALWAAGWFLTLIFTIAYNVFVHEENKDEN